MYQSIQGFNPRITIKYLFSILVSSLVYFTILSTNSFAIYDPTTVPNNKFGVHILDPNEVSLAAEYVNNNGGDWGYVTVPIQPSDRDQAKWQAFMHNCRDRHLIPIIRITTIPLGGTWQTGQDTDLVDFANFLSELDWPVGNRYIVLFNEVNRDTEWGGGVDPEAYAKIVKNAYAIFKERNQDYFMLGPALDSALPNSATSLSAANYLSAMQRYDSNIWSYFDGWASHSYPNPAFAASPTKVGWQSIVSYKTETAYLKLAAKPVFITETGWDQTKVSERNLDSYWRQAFIKWQQDPRVVAVTPFLLQGGEQFKQFSYRDGSGKDQPTGRILKDLAKSKGEPRLAGPQPTPTPKSQDDLGHTTGGTDTLFQSTSMMLSIENFFRGLFGLQKKEFIRIGTTSLTVELAENAKEWERGLSNRDHLDRDMGMLFVFPRLHVPIFWMKDMKFPIDIIWIKGDEVVGVEASVPVSTTDKLPTYSPTVAVDKVLEVPAGYAAEKGIEPGVKLVREQ